MRNSDRGSIRRLGLTFVALAGLATAALSLDACRRQTPAPPPTAPSAPDTKAAAAKAAAATAPVVARVAVQVTEEGFVPETIAAEVGKPITLAVTRKTDHTCAREILIKGESGKTDLPLDKEVEVTFTPKAAGPVKFGCGMGMMVNGTFDVRPAAAP
ncbi:MAG: cupredoxin domain-containing protein [Pseudomonadota bacterium]